MANDSTIHWRHRLKRPLAGIALCALAAGSLTLLPPSETVQARQALPAAASAFPGSFADLVEQVKPAVVNISTSGKVPGNGPSMQFPSHPQFEEFFRRFFGQPFPGHPQPQQRKMQALGSGFIVSADGYIVTNNHVVARADEISVILDNGDRLPAVLKATDEKTDLALLKVENEEDLPFVEFGDSDSARIGDWVIAIGNPFGLGGTTTTGIISARGRDLNSGPLDDFIQVDAPINQGNSGGPLFNLQGEVIGINTAIYSPNGGSVGIGFAIPSSIGQNVVKQLIADGGVSRGWLGVQIQEVNEVIAESLGIDGQRGALVARVNDDSPASSAGIETGDVILSFDGQAVESMRDLPRIVANTPAGKTVSIDVWRSGETITVDAVTGGDETKKVADAISQPETPKAKLGLELAQLTTDMRQRYGIDEKISGVLIVGVEPSSPAAEQGLRNGDVIVRVGKTEVMQPADVAKAVERMTEERKAVLFLVNRGGNDRFVALRIA